MSGVNGYQVVKFARTYLGAPFKLHGRNKRGIDCVGLIVATAEHFGLGPFDIPDYDLKGLNYDEAKQVFSAHGFPEIDPKRVQPGDVFTGRTLGGGITGLGIVSQTGGEAMFCNVRAVIHCETQLPPPRLDDPRSWRLPRMQIVEEYLGRADVRLCQNHGISEETLARVFRFHRFPFMDGG